MTTTNLKIMSVFGTRPEAIKMAPLVREMQAREEIEPVVCVTAQHRQMLDQVLKAFELKPDFDLDIMEKQQTLSTITTKAILGLETVLQQIKPDMVLVHGDTTTTFAAAIASFYNKVRVGHVEAGLRTYDKFSPYPEEMNRRLTGAIADLHFAPTAANRENLLRENITEHIYITGNTVIDALKTTVHQGYEFEEPVLNQIDFDSRRVILMTAHSRENYGEPMEQIMQAAAALADNNPNLLLVYPVHLSPYVQQTAQKYLAGKDNVKLIAPLGVMDMHNLMARVSFVMTDSGGLQEEAPSLGKPVLVLRKETERPEAVAAGTVKMVGVNKETILENAQKLLDDAHAYDVMAHAVNPFGDGRACASIVDDILYYFGRKSAPAPDFCGE